MKVNCSLPLNLSETDRNLFEGKTTYEVEPLLVHELRNVFVSHEGLCLKNLLLVKSSHFNLVGDADTTFYYPFWRLAVEQYLVSTFGKSLFKIHLSDSLYLHVYTKWFGYFFWITDVLPKLIKTQKLHKDVLLIYPQEWGEISFVNETLSLFNSLKHQIIPVGKHIQVKKLLLPETRKWSNAISEHDINLVRDFICQAIDERKVGTNYGERIYISRAKASRRKPVNEIELEAVLENFGFKSVVMEDLSFIEQMCLIRNAKYLIGLHGAGLANMVMLQPGASVLELSPRVNSVKQFRISFWRLANAVKANYFIQFCEVSEPQLPDVYDSNIHVDVAKFSKNIELMLSHLV